MERFKVKLILIVLILIAVDVSAEPIVIRDYGGHSSGVPDKASIAKAIKAKPLKQSKQLSLNKFPVRSTLMSGVLAKPIKFTNKMLIKSPYFILSNDERSLDWYAENKDYLVLIKAKGLATNIDSELEFKKLAEVVSPLTLSAIPLNDLALSLGLSVYPILITNEEIAQ